MKVTGMNRTTEQRNLLRIYSIDKKGERHGKKYRGQHYGAAAITAAEEWFAERGVKKIFINSRTEAVGFYEKLGYVADPKQITGTGAFQCIMTEKQL